MSDQTDEELIEAVRKGETTGWKTLISRHEARLFAWAKARTGETSAAEDVVQETFLSLVRALPNYDDSRPFEPFLNSIASHALSDALRKAGRRPRLSEMNDSAADVRQRMASSLFRSRETGSREEVVVAETLKRIADKTRDRGEFERLKCCELLFVAGLPNFEVAARLKISEQVVANHKSFVMQQLKEAARRAGLRDLTFDE